MFWHPGDHWIMPKNQHVNVNVNVNVNVKCENCEKNNREKSLKYSNVIDVIVYKVSI